MPLHMTKIAFDCADVAELRQWLESHAAPDGARAGLHGGEARLTTRYLPKRQAEMAGGSLYWVHGGALVGRSPLLGFAQQPDGKWWIRLAPRLITVLPQARRAHQGWRYLAADDAPSDLDEEAGGAALPGRLVSELARLGLV